MWDLLTRPWELVGEIDTELKMLYLAWRYR